MRLDTEKCFTAEVHSVPPQARNLAASAFLGKQPWASSSLQPKFKPPRAIDVLALVAIVSGQMLSPI